MSTYAVNAYNVAYQKAGYPFSYSHLFHAVWDTINKLLIANIITFIAYLMLYLIAAICELAHLNFVATFLLSPSVLIGYLYFFNLVGLYVADLSENVVKQLRSVLLNACIIFLPILSAVTIVYFAAFIYMFIFSKQNSFSYSTYLAICLLGITFINGVFQLGDNEKSYSNRIQLLINTFIILLPATAMLGIYSLYNVSTFDSPSIKSIGLNASNISSLILISLCLLYGLSYSIVLWRSEKKWLNSTKDVNIRIGYLIIIVVFCTNNSLFSNATSNFKNTSASNTQNMVINKIKELPTRDQAIANAGFSWSTNKKSKKIKPITVSYLNDNPVFLCRYKQENIYHAGTIRNGQCLIVLHSKPSLQNKFDVFTGNPQNVIWQPTASPYPSADSKLTIKVRDDKDYEVHICRTIYHDRLFIGETDPSGYCIFVDENNNVSNGIMDEILSVKGDSGFKADELHAKLMDSHPELFLDKNTINEIDKIPGQVSRHRIES